MKIKNRITTAFGLLGIAFSLFAGEMAASSPIADLPFQIKFETASDASSDGTNVLRIFVSTNSSISIFRDCDTVQLEILEIHHLGYSGPHKITRLFDRDTIVIDLPIDIPANDTSGLEFRFSGCGQRQHDNAFWVLNGDSVEFYRGNPRLLPRALFPPNSRKGPPKGREVRKPSTGPKITYGYIDEDGKFIEGEPPKKKPYVSKYIGELDPSDSTMAWKRNDSGWLEPTKIRTKRDIDIEKMREKEKTPLTEYDTQHISVGDEIWGRNKGEYKFTKVVMTTDRYGTMRHRADSIRALTKDRKYDLILDLRDSADYNFVRSLVNKLEATDSSGYYRVTMQKDDVLKLGVRNIKYSSYPRYPGQLRNRRRKRIDTGSEN